MSIFFDILDPVQRLYDGRWQKRKHDFMMSNKIESLAAFLRRPFHDINPRPVVMNHIKIGGGKMIDFAVYISRHGQRF